MLKNFTRPEYDPDTHFWLEVSPEFNRKLKNFFPAGSKVLLSTRGGFTDGEAIILAWQNMFEQEIVRVKKDKEFADRIVLQRPDNSTIIYWLNRKNDFMLLKVVKIEI